MGVYIKRMKMPKNCNSCFLDIYDRQTYCRNGEKELCPLIEVKVPHGRLIDADVFYENFSPKTWGDGMYVARRVESTATIIEEEE